ncbi:hypothetical protein NKH18_39005 [Streptomyces sp. M10(2022)]
MRKKFAKIAVLAAGVMMFSGAAGATAQAADGVPDKTVIVASDAACMAWGKAFVASGEYKGYGCMVRSDGRWDLDLMK